MFVSFRASAREQLRERIQNMLRMKVGGFVYDGRVGFPWFKYFKDDLELRSLESDLIQTITQDRDVHSACIESIQLSEERDLILNVVVNDEKVEVAI